MRRDRCRPDSDRVSVLEHVVDAGTGVFQDPRPHEESYQNKVCGILASAGGDDGSAGRAGPQFGAGRPLQLRESARVVMRPERAAFDVGY